MARVEANWAKACALGVIVALALGADLARAQPLDELLTLDLEALARLQVISATRYPEPAQLAPATVIVLRREELFQRGYRNLSEIFDDLPGMQVSRPYGDVYFKNYWRGLRRDVGSPYLVLVDGLELNDLQYNEDESLVALPMSNIDRVEVVYGPASAVYGANAFAGVINVITRQDMPAGESVDVRLSGGDNDNRIADATVRYRAGDWRTSLSLRYDRGELDTRHTESVEWTRQRYYGDPALWGGFLDNDNYGRFHSPHRHQAVDLRLGYRDTELTLQEWRTATGYGSEYPADLAQNYAYWRKPQRAVSLRHRARLGPDWDSSTLLRYRESSIDRDSDFLEGYNTVVAGNTRRVLDYSYWEHRNRSWALQQDVVWRAREDWLWSVGAQAEHKRLQKATWTSFGPALEPAAIPSADSYPLPGAPRHDSIAGNHIDTREHSLFLATRYEFPRWRDTDHILHLGARYDDQSEYGSTLSLRSGVVAQRGPWVSKVLVIGESFQEPPPRVLYGGWRGSGSDPRLRPEKARTVEFSLGYTQADLSALISAYRVHSRDNIINFSGGAQNLGGQVVAGLDLHLNALWSPRAGVQLRSWGYYSYADTDEARPEAGGGYRHGAIGDIARHAVRAGLTADLGPRWQTTWRGRYIGERPTVPTNPIGRVPSATVLDLNLTHRLSLAFSLALAVYNLADRRYVHPGVRQADAGLSPGGFDSNGVWQGSAGVFNSLLPQEGRTYLVTLQVEF